MTEPPRNPCLTCGDYTYYGCRASPEHCSKIEEVKQFAVEFAKFREKEISEELRKGIIK